MFFTHYLIVFINFIFFSKQNEIGNRILATASAMIGKYNYSWDGGTIDGPTHGIYQDVEPYCNDTEVIGFDCSGLVLYSVYQATKVILEHRAQEQFNNAEKYGATYVSIEQLEMGDIIFFGKDKSNTSITHVAIYSGNGMMVEAKGHGDNCIGPPVDEHPLSTRETTLINKAVRFSKIAKSKINERIFNTANAVIGKYPYSWDGGDINGATKGTVEEEPPYCNDTLITGFDCSGLALFCVYQATGIKLEHFAHIQYLTAEENGGIYVPMDNVEKGDIIFFGTNKSNASITHVAIYAGNHTMVEAQGHYDNCTGKQVLLSEVRDANLLDNAVRFEKKVCDYEEDLEDNDCRERLVSKGKKCCFLKKKNDSQYGKCSSFDSKMSIEKIKEYKQVEVAECSFSHVLNNKKIISLILSVLILI